MPLEQTHGRRGALLDQRFILLNRRGSREPPIGEIGRRKIEGEGT